MQRGPHTRAKEREEPTDHFYLLPNRCYSLRNPNLMKNGVEVDHKTHSRMFTAPPNWNNPDPIDRRMDESSKWQRTIRALLHCWAIHKVPLQWKSLAGLSRLTCSYPVTQQFHAHVDTRRNGNTRPHKSLHTNIHKASFRTVQIEKKNLQCPPTERINKMWPIHTMEYYWVRKRDETLIHAWMDPDNIVLSERSQAQKATSCKSVFPRNVQNRQIHRARK